MTKGHGGHVLLFAVLVGHLWALGDDSADLKLPKPGAAPVKYPGLANVLHVTDRLYNGSSPDGDAGFDSLRKLGIRTILSVDGARPDVTRARKFGMRYVHMPIGYDGVSQTQALSLAKAVRDLPGPIYLHCHHGKHRSPGAAAAIVRCLDKKCTAADAVAILKRAGTDPRYVGLYAAPRELQPATPDELDKLKVAFPETAPVPAIAQVMVHIDHYWENLTHTRDAGWKVPKDHSDLDPPHEALRLMEHYRELARLPGMDKRPADFKAWLAEAESAARDLEATLRKGAKDKAVVAEPAEKLYRHSRTLCARCHATYRDVPQTPR